MKNENRHQSKTSKTVETGKPPKLQFLVFTHVVNAWSRFRAHQHNGCKVSHMDGESLSQWLSAFRATREARAYAVATATRTPYIVQWNSAYSGWLSHPVLHEFYTRTCAFDWQFRCALWIKKIVTLALPARPWKIAPTLLFLFGLSMGYRYLFSMVIAIAIEKIRKCFRK